MKKKFRCLVCGYVYEGENPPAECPVCHVGPEKFVEIKDDGGKPQWACEHHLGDGQVEDAEVLAGLREQFCRRVQRGRYVSGNVPSGRA